MKIGGPKGPPRPAGPTESGRKPAPERGSFEDVLHAEGTSAGEPSPVARIAQQLRAGQITAPEAVDRLVDLVAHRGAGAAADPQLRQRLVDALRQVVANDPVLSERSRTLSGEDT